MFACSNCKSVDIVAVAADAQARECRACGWLFKQPIPVHRFSVAHIEGGFVTFSPIDKEALANGDS